MKRFLKYTIIALGAVCLLSACEEESKDTIAPGLIANVQVEPIHGGAKVTYELPDDEDVLFAKIYYTNTLGDDLFKVSSLYTNSITIDGFNDTLAHTFSIVAVDRSKNESEAVNFEFTPLKSNIQVVKESISIRPEFGGVKLSWYNPTAATVFAYLTYIEEGGEESLPVILSSEVENEELTVRGMDSTLKEFYVEVEDFYGNKTEKVSIGKVSPTFEEQIDKAQWTLVDALSVDGNAHEGRTEAMWDGVVDTKESGGQGSYAMISRDNNGGQLNFPLDIVIDMGNDSVVVNRLEIYQRAYWYNPPAGFENEPFYYQNENIKAFNIYTSANGTEWHLQGEFTLDDPRDEDGRVPAADIAIAEAGHAFVLDHITAPFRYLKFSITENFGSEIYVNISELTLYGSN